MIYYFNAAFIYQNVEILYQTVELLLYINIFFCFSSELSGLDSIVMRIKITNTRKLVGKYTHIISVLCSSDDKAFHKDVPQLIFCVNTS